MVYVSSFVPNIFIFIGLSFITIFFYLVRILNNDINELFLRTIFDYIVRYLGLLELKRKSECRTLAKFGHEIDFTVKLGDDLVCNYKTQSDSLSIHLLGVLNKSK